MAKLSSIQNLYKNQDILLFKRCYALEKIHGTASSINWNSEILTFSSGGEKHEKFISLFDQEIIKSKLINQGFQTRNVIIYGEAYGGNQQNMSETYGNKLKFVAFDVLLDDTNWLNVPQAEEFCKELNIEFVHWVEVSTDLECLDQQRDAISYQAVRNGVTTYDENTYKFTNIKPREGVVLRPLIEMIKSTGDRIICKHKGNAFRETATPRVVEDPNKLKVLDDASKIANEWVVVNRLEHILQKIPDHSMKKMLDIINAMVEDVIREGSGEIIDSEDVRKAIKAKTVEMYKNYVKSK